MSGVFLEQPKILVGELAYFFRQLPVVKPEFRSCKMIQSDLQRPAS